MTDLSTLSLADITRRLDAACDHFATIAELVTDQPGRNALCVRDDAVINEVANIDFAGIAALCAEVAARLGAREAEALPALPAIPADAPHVGARFINREPETGYIGCDPADTDDNGAAQDTEITVAPGAVWIVATAPFWQNGEWNVDFFSDDIPGFRGYRMGGTPSLAALAAHFTRVPAGL